MLQLNALTSVSSVEPWELLYSIDDKTVAVGDKTVGLVTTAALMGDKWLEFKYIVTYGSRGLLTLSGSYTFEEGQEFFILASHSSPTAKLKINTFIPILDSSGAPLPIVDKQIYQLRYDTTHCTALSSSLPLIFADNSIVTDQILNATLTSKDFLPISSGIGLLDNQDLKASSITNDKIGLLAASNIKERSLTSSAIGLLDDSRFGVKSLDDVDVASQAIEDVQIQSLSLEAYHLAFRAFLERNFKDGAFQSRHIRDNVLSSFNIIKQSLTSDNLAPNALTYPSLSQGSIRSDSIKNLTLKINDFDTPTAQALACAAKAKEFPDLVGKGVGNVEGSISLKKGTTSLQFPEPMQDSFAKIITQEGGNISGQINLENGVFTLIYGADAIGSGGIIGANPGSTGSVNLSSVVTSINQSTQSVIDTSNTTNSMISSLSNSLSSIQSISNSVSNISQIMSSIANSCCG